MLRFAGSTRRSARIVLLALLGLTIAGATIANAQDSQPWYQSYGNRGRLLGGLTIGGGGDISAVFYNPGQIAFARSSEVLLSASTYELQQLKYVNRSELEGEISSSHFGSSPSLVAGDFGGSGGSATRFAYSILSRQAFNADLRYRGRLDVDSLGEVADLGYAAFDLHSRPELSETWAGVTVSRQISPTFGLGVTTTVAVRSQSASSEFFVQGLASDTVGVIGMRRYDFDYTHWGLLAKVGALWQTDTWGLGVTVTTPRLTLFGSGSVGLFNGYVDQGALNGSREFVSTAQEDISARYRSPWAIGFGAHRAFGKTRVYASGEWYDAVATEAVLDAEPVTSEIAGREVNVDAVQDGRSIVNGGLGVEHPLSDTFVAFLALRTDFTTATESPRPNTSFTRWDLMHVSTGTTFRIAKSDFAIGVDYAFGSEDEIAIIPPGTPELRIPLVADARISSLSFLLGYKLVF